jgi:hypothetical protein
MDVADVVIFLACIFGQSAAVIRRSVRRPVFRRQPVGPQPAAPVAAVAGDLQHRHASSDFAEVDDAAHRIFCRPAVTISR